MKTLQAGVLALLALAFMALTPNSAEQNVPFVAAFRPLHSIAQPYTGNLRLSFNGSGIINGRYTDTSIRPYGPLANRVNATVTGGVNESGYIHFTIAGLAFYGKLNGTWISGTLRARGRLYEFKAREGTNWKPIL
jgi:hypothetical protein